MGEYHACKEGEVLTTSPSCAKTPANLAAPMSSSHAAMVDWAWGEGRPPCGDPGVGEASPCTSGVNGAGCPDCSDESVEMPLISGESYVFRLETAARIGVKVCERRAVAGAGVGVGAVNWPRVVQGPPPNNSNPLFPSLTG